jgi:hypothetical protein
MDLDIFAPELRRLIATPRADLTEKEQYLMKCHVNHDSWGVYRISPEGRQLMQEIHAERTVGTKTNVGAS